MHNKLTIVSDTAIYKKNGVYFAFGPVVREIESIDNLFTEIIWIGYNRPDRIKDLSMQEIKLKNINFILLKKVGGKSFISRLFVFLQYPFMFYVVCKSVYNSNVVHTRAPSHPAFIATVISFFMKNKIWWHKFAGSWNTETLPFFYKFQKNLLAKAKHSKVTINGFWNNQPKHCLSFENPCLTDEDIIKGNEIIKSKIFTDTFTLSFVGRLDEAKGVDVILEALKNVDLEKIEKIHFIGDGAKRTHFENEASFLNDKAVFHGFLNKESVHQLLAESNFLLLPSKSEGFPKVIAEAACYGVIPIVSNVGSISHYVNESNGFLWIRKPKFTFDKIMNAAFQEEVRLLENKSQNLTILAEKFTFTNYISKLEKEILH
jgi:glycosyltransferase involved in cell wall biosynthesis